MKSQIHSIVQVFAKMLILCTTTCVIIFGCNSSRESRTQVQNYIDPLTDIQALLHHINTFEYAQIDNYEIDSSIAVKKHRRKPSDSLALAHLKNAILNLYKANGNYDSALRALDHAEYHSTRSENVFIRQLYAHYDYLARNSTNLNNNILDSINVELKLGDRSQMLLSLNILSNQIHVAEDRHNVNSLHRYLNHYHRVAKQLGDSIYLLQSFSQQLIRRFSFEPPQDLIELIDSVDKYL